MIDFHAFYSTDNKELLVVTNKSNIQLTLSCKEPAMDKKWIFEFDDYQFQELTKYLIEQGNKLWNGFEPKEAKSFSGDYDEYYDREFDNNGYLSFQGLKLTLTGPWAESERLFQFNKRKLESFIFDCQISLDRRLEL
ncbi:hypothetical protein IW492_02880 [Enterococcus sp. BWB1-3]|uniref:hypothetical protein n=1 Tax=Enterococcus sp. BWB1-3 TaxID=2787713 RepID=UPI001921E3F5|nr:hypothetical protein [Enterococcus sp. BWB1-3]MBL1228176.1 hypothetical protein [Enterococcus sp. BWB1-3]